MTEAPWIPSSSGKFQRVDRVDAALTTKYDFDGGSYPVYIGEAVPGTATSSAEWRIQKREYTNGRLTSITWAGNGKFNQVYDNRASLSYS